MKIKRQKNNLIITIPLFQPNYDASGKQFGKISNLIGIIEGDNIGFAKVIELGYKNSFDYGEIIVKVYIGKQEFKNLCKKLNIELYEYPICSKCGKVIYGTCGWDNGLICNQCSQYNNK